MDERDRVRRRAASLRRLADHPATPAAEAALARAKLTDLEVRYEWLREQQPERQQAMWQPSPFAWASTTTAGSWGTSTFTITMTFV